MPFSISSDLLVRDQQNAASWKTFHLVKSFASRLRFPAGFVTSFKHMNRRAFVKSSLSTGALAAASRFALPSNDAGTLRAAGTRKNLLVGSAVSHSQLQNASLTPILAEQCNILVAENEMKWWATEPERGQYDFTEADELMVFAERNSMRVRGHNLCWHEYQPPWFANMATRENAAGLLRGHIQTVAGRYAGRIHSWDVINEAIDPDSGRKDGMRDSLWMQLLGLRYIGIAFHAAAEADPKALLTYNDFGLEDDYGYNERRREVTLQLLKWMRANRIPIHALGLQSHLMARYDYLPDWGGLHAFLKQVAKLDLQVFVTEFDINDTELASKPEKRAKQVAELCRDYLKHVLKHPQVTALLTWGLVSHPLHQAEVTDKQHIALPLDEQLRPTPFLSAMMETIEKR
jgi:endo-1,4-beta-xylanase